MNGMYKDVQGYHVYFKIEENLEVMGVMDDRKDWWYVKLGTSITSTSRPDELKLPEEYLL